MKLWKKYQLTDGIIRNRCRLYCDYSMAIVRRLISSLHIFELLQQFSEEPYACSLTEFDFCIYPLNHNFTVAVETFIPKNLFLQLLFILVPHINELCFSERMQHSFNNTCTLYWTAICKMFSILSSWFHAILKLRNILVDFGWSNHDEK